MPKISKWLGDAMEGLVGSKMPKMQVIATDYINPSLKRIRFKGPLQGMNFQLGYAVVLRVSDTEYRNYTASFSDTREGLMEILVHVHGDAPGSRFMDELKPEDHTRISMPRGMKMYDPQVYHQLLFGDETSLGLACSFYEVLKRGGHGYHFYFELDATNAEVPGLLGLDHYTVFTKNTVFRDETHIQALPVFTQEADWLSGNFILTGNARSVQNFRRVLKQNNCQGRIHTKAYWAEGKTGL